MRGREVRTSLVWFNSVARKSARLFGQGLQWPSILPFAARRFPYA